MRYLGLIRALATKDIKSRYSGSLLGPLWLLLQPLFMVFIYTVVFSKVMHARLPGSDVPFAYSIYLCAGLLPWNAFLDVVQRGKSVFIEHANLIKKASFPRLILFVPVVAVALFNFLTMFLLFLAFLALTGAFPGPLVLLVVPLVLLTVALALVVGIVLAVLNVFFRDVGQTADMALQLLFWATPIVYPLAVLPEWVRDRLFLNPLVGITAMSQGLFLGNAPPWQALLWPLALILFLGLGSVLLYRRSYADMLDEL